MKTADGAKEQTLHFYPSAKDACLVLESCAGTKMSGGHADQIKY